MRIMRQFAIATSLILGLGLSSPALSLPLRLAESEIVSQLDSVPEWSRLGHQSLQREFVFGDFREAIAFVQSLVEPADNIKHHPNIIISYNRVILVLTTHDVGGLTQLDFDLAQAINQLFSDVPE